MQEPENRTRLVQCLHEEQKPCVDPESLEPEKVICSLQDMGFAEAHIHSLFSIQPVSYTHLTLPTTTRV